MARALEQILSELDSVYSPQKDVYSQQIGALPGQEQAQLGGLEQARKDSFNQILTGANRRGVAFGGIPLAEQASYLGSSYLPAVANLKGKFQGQKSDLELRLAELAGKQRGEATDIWKWEMEQDAAAKARAASGGGGASGRFDLTGDGTTPIQDIGGWQMIPKAGGGFSFTNAAGIPVSAATYAQATADTWGGPDKSFTTLLNYMAANGDAGAKQALGFVGGDYGYDPTKVLKQGDANLYNALTWGGVDQQASPLKWNPAETPLSYAPKESSYANPYRQSW